MEIISLFGVETTIQIRGKHFQLKAYDPVRGRFSGSFNIISAHIRLFVIACLI